MWILRAPVRITLLLQGSKLEPQGTAKGMKTGNVWPIFMRISRAPVRITILLQGSKWGPHGTTKGLKMEIAWLAKKHKRLLCEFCAPLSGAHFCCKDPNWDRKGQPKEWKWKMSDGQKNKGDFYVIFARACQDHTFAARTQVETPRDSQRNEHGQFLMGKKHKRFFYEFCARMSGSHFSRKDPSWDPKGQPKEWKWEMSEGPKNINDFYVNLARTCQHHTFAAGIQVGTPKGQPKEWKWKMSDGKKKT